MLQKTRKAGREMYMVSGTETKAAQGAEEVSQFKRDKSRRIGAEDGR